MPSDDFGPPLYEPTQDEPRKGRGLARAILAGIAVAVLFAIVWNAYDLGKKSSGDGETPPLIKAEEGPTKERPDEPGGMDVPDQDKLIYNRLNPDSSDKSGETVEHLLPMPEKPVTPPASLQTTEVTPPPPPTPPVGAATAGAPAVPTNGNATKNAAKETKLASAPPVEKGAPAPLASAGSYRIQLGAVRSSEAAEKEWKQLAAAHQEILGGLTLRVQTVNLPDKGTYYRIQAGTFADAAEAKKACEALVTRKQGCLVVAP